MSLPQVDQERMSTEYVNFPDGVTVVSLTIRRASEDQLHYLKKVLSKGSLLDTKPDLELL